MRSKVQSPLATRRIILSQKDWRRVDAHAERYQLTSREIVSRIVMGWLDAPNVGGLRLDRELLGPSQAGVMTVRERVVRRFIQVREEVARRGGLRDGRLGRAVDRMIGELARQDGIRVSRRSVYNWYNEWCLKGREGLVDRRLVRRRTGRGTGGRAA